MKCKEHKLTRYNEFLVLDDGEEIRYRLMEDGSWFWQICESPNEWEQITESYHIDRLCKFHEKWMTEQEELHKERKLVNARQAQRKFEYEQQYGCNGGIY